MNYAICQDLEIIWEAEGVGRGEGGNVVGFKSLNYFLWQPVTLTIGR